MSVPGLALRVVLLAVAHAVLFAAAFALVGPDVEMPEESIGAASGLAFALATPAVISWWMLRARVSGWRLVLPVVLVLFGVMSFQSQIESAIFVVHMTRADVLRVMAAGALFTLLFVPLAAAAFGRWRQTPEFAPASGRLTPGRLALLSVLYLVLYMVFGYYVAWVRPEVRAFYGGADPTGFFGNLITLTREQPELYLFQLARGALWAGLAWLFVRSVVASRAEVALLAGAVLSLPIALQLLAPNPFMPAEVRIPHLFEVAISNFLFGAIAALVLLRGSPVPAVSRAEGMPPVDPRPAPDMRSHAALAHA